MNTTPFHINRQVLSEHSSILRCSQTAQELWIKVLEECYCHGTLECSKIIQYLADQKDIEQEIIHDLFCELITKKVCSISSDGTITPIRPDYLNPDFWQKIHDGKIRDNHPTPHHQIT